jgi:hypothetical protein
MAESLPPLHKVGGVLQVHLNLTLDAYIALASVQAFESGSRLLERISEWAVHYSDVQRRHVAFELKKILTLIKHTLENVRPDLLHHLKITNVPELEKSWEERANRPLVARSRTADASAANAACEALRSWSEDSRTTKVFKRALIDVGGQLLGAVFGVAMLNDVEILDNKLKNVSRWFVEKTNTLVSRSSRLEHVVSGAVAHVNRVFGAVCTRV